MRNGKIRTWIVVMMTLVAAGVGVQDLYGKDGPPSVQPDLGVALVQIVTADAHHAEQGIERFLLHPARDDGMSITVLGDLDYLSRVHLSNVAGQSAIRISMLANGDELDLLQGPDTIEVIQNSGTVIYVEDGEFLVVTEGQLDNAAGDVLFALISDKNLNRAISKRFNQLGNGTPGIGIDCASSCRQSFPRPADCEGMIDAYYCCMIEAQYDTCRRACNCDLRFGIGTKKANACIAAALALGVLEEGACILSLPFR